MPPKKKKEIIIKPDAEELSEIFKTSASYIYPASEKTCDFFEHMKEAENEKAPHPVISAGVRTVRDIARDSITPSGWIKAANEVGKIAQKTRKTTDQFVDEMQERNEPYHADRSNITLSDMAEGDDLLVGLARLPGLIADAHKKICDSVGNLSDHLENAEKELRKIREREFTSDSQLESDLCHAYLETEALLRAARYVENKRRKAFEWEDKLWKGTEILIGKGYELITNTFENLREITEDAILRGKYVVTEARKIIANNLENAGDTLHGMAHSLQEATHGVPIFSGDDVTSSHITMFNVTGGLAKTTAAGIRPKLSPHPKPELIPGSWSNRYADESSSITTSTTTRITQSSPTERDKDLSEEEVSVETHVRNKKKRFAQEELLSHAPHYKKAKREIFSAHSPEKERANRKRLNLKHNLNHDLQRMKHTMPIMSFPQYRSPISGTLALAGGGIVGSLSTTLWNFATLTGSYSTAEGIALSISAPLTGPGILVVLGTAMVAGGILYGLSKAYVALKARNKKKSYDELMSHAEEVAIEIQRKNPFSLSDEEQQNLPQDIKETIRQCLSDERYALANMVSREIRIQERRSVEKNQGLREKHMREAMSYRQSACSALEDYYSNQIQIFLQEQHYEKLVRLINQFERANHLMTPALEELRDMAVNMIELNRACEQQNSARIIAAATHCLRFNEDNYKLHALLAEAYYQQKNYAEAIRYACIAIDIQPHFKMQWFLANLYLENGDENRAIATLKDILKEREDCFEANILLADLSLKNNRNMEAQKYYRAAEENCPEDSCGLLAYNLGVAALRTNHYQEAYDAFKEARQIDGESADLDRLLFLLQNELAPTDEEASDEEDTYVHRYQKTTDEDLDASENELNARSYRAAARASSTLLGRRGLARRTPSQSNAQPSSMTKHL